MGPCAGIATTGYAELPRHFRQDVDPTVLGVDKLAECYPDPVSRGRSDGRRA